jgi:2-oxoglutarate dehydrogenase complex dehydrogenase (E1) component-like enzyme
MNGVYKEVLLILGPEKDDVDYLLLTYSQPKTRHWIAFGHRVWERLTWRPLRRIEKPFWNYHEKHCQVDCAQALNDQGKWVPMCGYVPLSTRQELRNYDLEHAGRKKVSEVHVGYDVARHHGWKHTPDL